MMRHYETDSAHAAARVLSLTLMADGAPDKSEFDCLNRTGALEQIGIDQHAFEAVLREFCEDVEQSVGYFDALNHQLSPDLIDALLDEVRDPHSQRLLLHSIVEIAIADGFLSDGERQVLSRAVALWGMQASWPVRLRPEQAS